MKRFYLCILDLIRGVGYVEFVCHFEKMYAEDVSSLRLSFTVELMIETSWGSQAGSASREKK
jgi:hypothetical protein